MFIFIFIIVARFHLLSYEKGLPASRVKTYARSLALYWFSVWKLPFMDVIALTFVR